MRVCGISELMVDVDVDVAGWGNNGRTLWLTENMKRNAEIIFRLAFGDSFDKHTYFVGYFSFLIKAKPISTV